MPEQYESLDQKPYESHYLFFERVFDHEIERVWPYALDIGAWMTDHRLVTIAGEPGKVGHFERVYAARVGDEVPGPHYHVYGVAELIPPRFTGLEYFPEKGGSYGDSRERFGFDALLLSDLGQKTKLTFLLIEVKLGRATEAKPAADGEDQTMRERIERYFDNLGLLLEGAK